MPITKLNYNYRSLETLSEVTEIERAKLQRRVDRLPCRLWPLSLCFFHAATGSPSTREVSSIASQSFSTALSGDKSGKTFYFNPNIPSEEVFTTPVRGLAEGKVVATKPVFHCIAVGLDYREARHIRFGNFFAVGSVKPVGVVGVEIQLCSKKD